MSIDRTELLAFPIGTVIARYRLVSAAASGDGSLIPLGEGGSGVVFLAEQELHGGITVKRAVKFFVYREDVAALSRHQETGPVSVANFRNEIQHLSAFHHHNIIRVIEAGFWQTSDEHSMSRTWLQNI